MKHSHKNSKGFTLVELLIVISIIGVLSAIVISSLNSARSKSRDSARITSMLETRKALQVYFNDNGEFPYIDGSGGSETVADDQWKDRVGSGLVDLGYIKEVHPDIRYYALRENFSNSCGAIIHTCVAAFLYVKLENRNNVLNSDRDRNYDNGAQVYTPDGLSTLDNCNAEASITGATDLCFDLEV